MTQNKSYIERPHYLRKIEPFIGKDIIKVITGQRRVGKSYMLFQIMDRIRQLDPHHSIIYINLELNEFQSIDGSTRLYDYVKSKIRGKRNHYLLIDEVQMVKGFELALKSLLAEGICDIYITGSNARLLSGDLATLLTGRTVEIQIHTLTYSEFIKFHKLEDNSGSLDQYLKYGGLPYLRNLQLDDTIVFDYLDNIYRAILFRDVVSRHEVRNVVFLEQLVRFLANHTGSLISARKISDFLKSQNVTVSVTMVLNYLDHLTSSYFISRVKRSDIEGKRIFEVGEKYYFNDIGIRNSVVGFRPFDLGMILENALYLYLRYCGFIVMVGKSGEKEIDFIAEKNSDRIYVQAALRIEEKKTMEREFGNLLGIEDNHPKYVVTLDEYTGTSHKGIQHIPLRKFLTMDL